MNRRDDALLPEIRRDTRARVAVTGAYLLCAIVGAGMFGASGTIEEHGWSQYFEDLGEAFTEWPLPHFGYIAAMVVGLLWPRTPLVLFGFAGAFLAAMGPGLIHGMRIT